MEYNYCEADEMEIALVRREEANNMLDHLFNYYNKGYIYLKDLDDKCAETINGLYWDIYKETHLTQPEILDFISEIKADTYSHLAELYKKRMRERG